MSLPAERRPRRPLLFALPILGFLVSLLRIKGCLPSHQSVPCSQPVYPAANDVRILPFPQLAALTS